MKYMVILTFFIFVVSNASADVFPNERRVNWENAGLNKMIEFNDTVKVTDLGIIGDGIISNDTILNELIKSLQVPTVIFFPPGKYLFTGPVYLKSNIILRGESYKETEFIFNHSSAESSIIIMGNALSEANMLTANANFGQNYLKLQLGHSVNHNEIFYLFDEDSAKITSDWAKNSTGQICRAMSSADEEIMIYGNLRRDYSLNDNPRIIRIIPVQNIGIESLKIQRKDKTESQTSNILFQYADNCWVKCVESENCNFGHIDIRNSINIEVDGCYFHDAFDYGGGGKGYGVVLHSSSGDCLVYNNIFEHLRHSVLLQSGANGNVICYNYSTEPFWTGVSLPSNSAGDLVLHGNYPYCNLFEGNIVQNIVIDNSHGINGPYNTFFRNRAELYGIFMNSNPASDGQNFIANEITNTGFLMGLYVLAGENHFEYGNNIKGTILPETVGEIPANSLFTSRMPEFYRSKSKWPPIGITNNLNENSIEAFVRYKQKEYTSCIRLDDGNNTSVTDGSNLDSLGITGSFPYDASEINIFDITGRFAGELDRLTDSQSIPPGFYFVKYKSRGIIHILKFIKTE